jgi:hypothetical protein
MHAVRFSTRRRLVTLLALATLVLASTGVAAPPVVAKGPGGEASAVLAAQWLASQLGPDGAAESTFAPGAPDPDSTRDIAVALAATGVDEDAFNAAYGWLRANIETVIAGDGDGDSAGDIGWMLLLVGAAGDDPANVGGVNLLARLAATLDALEPGLYGGTDPTFDGVFRQSVALLGLIAVGVAPPDDAVAWLTSQQCTPGNGAPAADGGFTAYRDPAVPCTAPDAATYSGPDTDSTALAIQALTAVGATPGIAAALDFLAATQDASGGFGWYAGSDAVPNSTGLAIAAIVAAGEDPTGGRWASGGTDPVTWLVDQQLPCGDDDAGAFTSIYSDGAADQFATRQAVLGVALMKLPLAELNFGVVAEPCATPEAPGDPGTPATPDTAATAPEPAHASPRFTG